jgi:hypothetical protein
MESIIAGAFCLLIGIVGLWTGLRALKTRTTLDRWPTTTGRVTERSTFKPDYASGPPAFRHAPLVRYVYQVGGKDFVNDRIQPKQIQQPRHNTEAWAQQRAAEFPDQVIVHYNPADPGESFLLQTSKRTLYVVIGASFLAILFSGLFFMR